MIEFNFLDNLKTKRILIKDLSSNLDNYSFYKTRSKDSNSNLKIITELDKNPFLVFPYIGFWNFRSFGYFFEKFGTLYLEGFLNYNAIHNEKENKEIYEYAKYLLDDYIHYNNKIPLECFTKLNNFYYQFQSSSNVETPYKMIINLQREMREYINFFWLKKDKPKNISFKNSEDKRLIKARVFERINQIEIITKNEEYGGVDFNIKNKTLDNLLILELLYYALNKKIVSECAFCKQLFLLKGKQVQHYKKGKPVYCQYGDTFSSRRAKVVNNEVRCQDRDRDRNN